MTAAFAYLIGRSTRNRLLAQARRIRNPRYAIALIVGILYFVLVFSGRSTRGGASPFLGPTMESLAPLLIALTLSSSWFFGGDRTALAFTQGEVAILFTGPVTRRALLLYKIVRSQITILVSVLIWSVILRRGGTPVPAILSAVAFWALFTTMSLHRLGAALIRAKNAEAAAKPARRNRVSLIVVVVIIVVFMSQAATAGHGTGARNPFAAFDAVAAAIASEPMRTLLTPFRMIAAPAFAKSVADWGAAMLPALALLAVHIAWVLTSKTRFEEVAAIASSEHAQLIDSMRRNRGTIPSQAPRARARTLPLAPRGPAAVAILWKNMLVLMRASGIAMIVGPLLVALGVSVAVPNNRGSIGQTIAFVSIFIVLFLVLIGGRVLRNDLRSDMLHLPLLKTLPLRGADIVLAEVASGVLPLVVLQQLLVIVSYISFTLSGAADVLRADILVAFLVASPFVLLALDAASFTILNGTAVLFPAWVRLGPSGPGGIEAMGQNILTTFGTWLTLILLLIVPSIAVVVTMAFTGGESAAGLAVGLIAGSLILGAETYGVIRWLGRVFERAEPHQVPQ